MKTYLMEPSTALHLRKPNIYSPILPKILLFFPLLLAMLLFGVQAVEAANRFVRAGATGANNGSDWINAYTTLPSSLVRGDTYYIASGAYGGYTFNTSGSAVTTVKKATVSDHGTDTGWNDSYGTGQAVFSGKIEFTTSNWVFDGVTGGGAENNWNQNFGFKIIEQDDANALIRIAFTGTADNITLRHLEMQGKGSVSVNGGSYSNDGLAVYGASNVTLSYFWMYGIGRCPFFMSPQNFIAEHGWVQSFYGSSAVHSEIASIWAFDDIVGNTTFRYNLFTDIQSTGGIMWDNQTNPTSRLDIYGNIFYKPAGAIWEEANGVIGGWTAREFHNVHVYNNTFINVNQQSLSTFPQVASGSRAYNNLWYNSDSPDFSNFESHDYNHFINSGGTHSEPNGTSASSGDPFVDYANRNFRLKGPTAPGITLASPFNLDPLDAISLDLLVSLGSARGADGIWDRGAFEFEGNRPSPPANLRLLQ